MRTLLHKLHVLLTLGGARLTHDQDLAILVFSHPVNGPIINFNNLIFQRIAGELHDSFIRPINSTKKRPHSDHLSAGGTSDSIRSKPCTNPFSSNGGTRFDKQVVPMQPSIACPTTMHAKFQLCKRRRLVSAPGSQDTVPVADEEHPSFIQLKTRLWKCLRSTMRLQELQPQFQKQSSGLDPVGGQVSRHLVNLMESNLLKALGEPQRNKDSYGSLSLR